MQGDGTVLIENAEIAFRNFAGREDMYNREGDRNFCVMLPQDLERDLDRDGWNIKHLKVREEGDIPQGYLPVSVKYRGRDGKKVKPPELFMVTSKGRTRLDEETVEILDYMDIARVDLIIRPYEWRVSGKSGVKAYVKTLYFFVAEDALALRYNDIPEVGIDGNQLALESAPNDDVIDGEAWFEDEGRKELEG